MSPLPDSTPLSVRPLKVEAEFSVRVMPEFVLTFTGLEAVMLLTLRLPEENVNWMAAKPEGITTSLAAVGTLPVLQLAAVSHLLSPPPPFQVAEVVARALS